MKSEKLRKLFLKFRSVAAELEGLDTWNGRGYNYLLGFSKWINHKKVIQRLKAAYIGAVEKVANLFAYIRQIFGTNSGYVKESDYILFTRFNFLLISEILNPKI